jgi:hypothetical protein
VESYKTYIIILTLPIKISGCWYIPNKKSYPINSQTEQFRKNMQLEESCVSTELHQELNAGM